RKRGRQRFLTLKQYQIYPNQGGVNIMAATCDCKNEGNCPHICHVKKRGGPGAAQLKAYRSMQKFVCEKCGEKVAKAEYVCYPKPL
ncbi:MAG: hypothetical protein K6E31_03785, partial [bacterium]|nr:hypothetical protein [bacterium]